jgi:two-component system sensor histidine kinase KdpD
VTGVDGGLSGAQMLHRTSVMLLTGFAAGVLSRQRQVQRRERQTLQVLVDERSVELGQERAEVERLRRVDVAKSEFVAVAAHEFRTPLAAVIGVLSTLKEHGDILTPEERDELLVGASAQAARLARLVDDQLTVSRIEDGVLRLQIETVDPRHLLAEAAQSSEMTGRLVIQLGRVDRVRCDQDAIIRVLTNLLDNARKYSPADSKVHITVGREGDLVRFRVRDEGPGIPEAERDQVFERFHRLDGGAAKPGTGLGLYICRALVEAHGGRIGVEAASEGGTIFSFTLPRATKTDVDASRETPDDASAGTSAPVPEAVAEVPSAAVN